MRTNWVLKCNYDCMCWSHAWLCHLQNQTSGCSVLKMQPHYPLLQNFEKSQCTIKWCRSRDTRNVLHMKELWMSADGKWDKIVKSFCYPESYWLILYSEKFSTYCVAFIKSSAVWILTVTFLLATFFFIWDWKFTVYVVLNYLAFDFREVNHILAFPVTDNYCLRMLM